MSDQISPRQDVHPPLPPGLDLARAPLADGPPPAPDPAPLDLIRSLESQFDRFRRAADEASQRTLELDRRQAELEARARALDERAALAEAGSRPEPHGDTATRNAELESAHALIAERETAIALLADRLRSGESEGPGADNGLRKRRLARYKMLLGQQSRKLIAAKNALAKRQAECELVLGQRARLAEQAVALEARRAEVEQRAARGTGATIAACACVVVGIVAGLAWTIAGIAAPATYAARAVLAPKDAAGAAIEDVRAWTQAHLALAADPLVYAEAAEHFARRGVEPLATAAGVQERFARDLYAVSDAPGSVSLELRGPGRDRTVRDLETFVSALLARSEAGREMRAGGLAPAVTVQPVAGDEPLSSARLVYAAALSGAGMVLAGAAGVIGYAALARSKQRFEREQPLGV